MTNHIDTIRQALPFGVGGALVAIKTLLSRDPCVHANTAIEMIDAILAEQPAQQEPTTKHTKPFESARVGDYNRGWNDCLFASGIVKQTEQPAQQEPVGYADSRDLEKDGNWDTLIVKHASEMREGLRFNVPLYTTTPAAQRQWVGLTDEEIENVWRRVQANDFHDCVQPFARAIEAKLKEENT